MTGPAPESGGPPLLALEGVAKSYASFALEGVTLELRRGEVHALVGENGAGKSTLSKVIAGLVAPDAGTMTLGRRAYAPASRKAAEHEGVRMVMQELNLIANLSVAENLFLDQLPHRWGWIDQGQLQAQARAVLAQVGLDAVHPSRQVQTLGVGQQQLVEIAAGLSRKCEVLILDEPTAALTDPEIELLFEQIRLLRGRGVGIVYISHRMEEIRRLADRITVLRDGRLVATRSAAETPLDEIVRLMVGREIGEAVHRRGGAPGPVALRACGLRRGDAVRGAGFEAHHGEILGFAGLMGSGRTETMRLVFGADPADGGAVYLRGSETPAKLNSPREAVRAGIALLTEDRKEQGLLLGLSIRANTTLARLGPLARFGFWLRREAERAVAEKWRDRLRLRCGTVEQRVVELSGGNQQKVVLAKWLYRDCDILIFDEPTRGIDVGAKFEIYGLLGQLADEGKAVLVVSSDLKELLGICDRIAVMSAGRVAAVFRRGEWTQDKIMAAALSGYLGNES